MKSTIVSVSGAATPIPATIPAKFVVVRQDGVAPLVDLIANLRREDGSDGPDETYLAGASISNLRRDGIIARPPGYSAYQVPVTGEGYMKLRTGDGSTVNVQVHEYEQVPDTAVL